METADVRLTRKTRRHLLAALLPCLSRRGGPCGDLLHVPAVLDTPSGPDGAGVRGHRPGLRGRKHGPQARHGHGHGGDRGLRRPEPQGAGLEPRGLRPLPADRRLRQASRLERRIGAAGAAAGAGDERERRLHPGPRLRAGAVADRGIPVPDGHGRLWPDRPAGTSPDRQFPRPRPVAGRQLRHRCAQQLCPGCGRPWGGPWGRSLPRPPPR